jgi:hypothetical protein
MDGDIIKEYLIALGFKLDEDGWRKFNAGLTRSAKDAAELGSTVVATATAIGIAVTKVARQQESLYYASQRTGSTVNNLLGHERAAKQIGLTWEQARSSVEGFGAALRNQPGLTGVLRAYGVTEKDPQKQLLQLVENLKKRFGERGYVAASRIGGMFGQGESEFRMLWMNLAKLRTEQAEQDRRMREAGVTSDGTAEKFVTFTNALDKMLDSLGNAGTRIGKDFIEPATRVVTVIDEIVQAFNRLDEKTKGSVGFWGTLATSALGVLVAKRAAVRAAQFFRRGAGAAETAAGGAAGTAARGMAGGAAARMLGPLGWYFGMTDEANAGEKDIYKHNPETGRNELTEYGRELERQKNMPEPGAKKRAGLGEALGGLVVSPAEAATRPREEMDGRAPAVPGRERIGVYVARYFESRGWSREAAAGIAANLQRESNFDPRATGDQGTAHGVAQWRGERMEAFRQFAGKDIKFSTIEEQLRFVHHELTAGKDFGARRAGDLLRDARSAAEAAAIVTRLYERPRDAAGEAQRRGVLAEDRFQASLAPSPAQAAGATATISQKTDIHIAPGDTAGATAKAVADMQGRVNGDLVRNTAGAIR